MESDHSSLRRLRSKAIWLGATLTMAAFAIVSVPAFTRIALSKTHSHAVTPTRLAQQATNQWIEIDLSKQQLIAWNGRTPVRTFLVSTGKRSTPTHPGTFAIQSKYRSSPMRGANYYVPDVPYTMYFSGGYALHGAYWHNRFGSPVSHGCVNLRVSSARWLYNWASTGTPVVIHH